MGDMDSVNSGSIQSSSTGGGGGGDDQEFDSRATLGGGPIPTFFHNTVPFHHQLSTFNNTFLLPPFSPSLPNNNNNNTTTNNNDYNNNNNNNNNNMNDLGMVWGDKYSSIIKPSNVSSIYSSPVDGPRNCTTTGLSPTQKPLPTSRVSTEGAPVSSDHPRPEGGGRNPKKRSRASRRAPTTVLTTDTNNFRQMVQEFTGIPAPPFSGRTRLDLFGGLGIQLPNSIMQQSLQPPQQQQSPYVLRPFPQKIVPNNNNNNHSFVMDQPQTQQHGPGSTRINASGSLMDEFALDHSAIATSAVTAAIATNHKPTNTTIIGGGKSTTINSGNIIMSALNNHDRVTPLQRHHVNACNDDVGGVFNIGNDGGVNAGSCLGNNNHGSGGVGVGRSSEGMMDSWICSSSDN